MIATNTLAQGETRSIGLDGAVARGFTITRAIKSQRWPAAGANLEFAAVWGTTGDVPEEAGRIVDGLRVSAISTMLEPARRVEGHPSRLQENAGRTFEGCKLAGIGFVVSEEEARAWIRASATNAEVLAPYLNGDDLNSTPDMSARRWAIDFNDMSEERARKYREPFAHVEATVKPVRMRNNREVYRRYWWQYAERRPAMRAALTNLDEVLVLTRVSKAVVPTRVTTSQVLSDMLTVFAFAGDGDLAVLSSSLHQIWAITYASTLETRVRYTPSECFETFPRPEQTPWLVGMGRTLDESRREIMLRRDLGLTKLYNLVNDAGIGDASDPDVARMRAIHVELDQAAMDAYGWSGISLDHGFHTYRQMERWSVSPAARVEVLDRLLEENHKRAGAEGSTGLRKSKRHGAASDHNQVSLFGDA